MYVHRALSVIADKVRIFTVSLMTILFEFTCVMDVKDQTTKRLSHAFCPFCKRASKFVHGP